MTRTNALLLVLLVLSALLLVRTTYDSRRLFSAIDRARTQERTLEAEFQRLDAERRQQATHLRVEKVAREKLQMRNATAALTHYTADAAGAAGAAGTTAAATPAGTQGAQ
ncbi:MAG: cell division protein FtsL [Rubrivivax sp.]